MKKSLPFALLTVAIICLLYTPSASSLMVRITGNRITIEADQTPLQTLLKALAYQGIRIQADPELNPIISASIHSENIQTGLSMVLKSVNHVLVWEASEVNSNSTVKLAEIQIFRPGKRSSMKPLYGKKNLTILRNPADGALYVKDEILIHLKPNQEISKINDLINRINGSITEKNASTGVYLIHLPEDSDVYRLREEIIKHPDVAAAEPNFAYPLFSPAPPIPSLNNTTEAVIDSTGKPAVSIAVLDSGYTNTGTLDEFIGDKFNAIDPDEPAVDTVGHGTQMALIATGMIKPHGVKSDAGGLISVLPVKIFDENGYASNFSILQSIDFAVKKGAKVLSLSWGSETRSQLLEQALDGADSKGLIVVASAGNTPTGEPVYPAAFPTVIGAGALAPDGKLWEQSNRGDFVTLYAPGFGTLPVGYKGDPGVYAGTSIAAAFTANMIADYLSRHPTASKTDVLKAITGKD